MLSLLLAIDLAKGIIVASNASIFHIECVLKVSQYLYMRILDLVSKCKKTMQYLVKSNIHIRQEYIFTHTIWPKTFILGFVKEFQ